MALRLCTVEELDGEPDILPFPRLDLHEVETEDGTDGRLIDSLDLAHRIESTLDQLQERLDRVKEELDAVYRFPTAQDWPPTAA